MADSSIKTLEKMLDIAAFRQKILASNIANSETPGYRARDISFQNELEKAKSAFTGADRHSTHSYEIYETVTTMSNQDDNTVNLDIEMAKVAENTLIYNTATQLLSMKIRMMKDVLRGGR
ncbi:MAG: flagellar basal body rod protein FlgB [Alphaproteobacteria bacterium]|uniref:Flagellar basal body rod protein FlgB n=1 Tax=Candidatus Nitrobium versatile TaxID=2884831 RepID=A0A953M1A6_9BACT|nr:flagellar basal body rod protein FlgB [Candidatus Nitrobium versatile]